MSANYYWHEPPCPAPCAHCAGANVLHIGKFTGAGWSFEGHFKGDEPWLTTAAQWWEFLRANPGVIRDEYRRDHDVEAFIAEVEAVPAVGRRRQYDWLDQRRDEYGRYMDVVARHYNWLDADGFSFYGGEFS